MVAAPPAPACLIDLAVRKKEAPALWIVGSVGEDQFKLNLDHTCTSSRFNQVALIKGKVLLLAESEKNFDRIDGRNGG